jgi:hypothetical protein
MHAALLSVIHGDASTDGLPDQLGGGLPAADIDATAYLDGRTIHHGTLAGHVTDEVTAPVVDEDGIGTVTEQRDRRALADVYADLEAGWAGAASGDGERLLAEYLAQHANVLLEGAVIDLGGFVDTLPDDVTTNGIAYSESIEEGDHRDAAGAEWHDAASLNVVDTETVSLLSLTYAWDGGPVDCVLAESGYVAVYGDWSAEQFARWVADAVEPHLAAESGGQTRLGTADVCERCERESDSVEPRPNGEDLCIVCWDGISEDADGDGEFSDLDTVTMGGETDE